MNAAVGLMDGLGLDGDRCIRVVPRQLWLPNCSTLNGSLTLETPALLCSSLNMCLWQVSLAGVIGSLVGAHDLRLGSFFSVSDSRTVLYFGTFHQQLICLFIYHFTCQHANVKRICVV